MAHATEERTKNPQGNQPQFKVGQPSHPPKNEGEAFEYQKDKPITGEQHGSGAERAGNQPTHKEHHQTPPGAKR